MAEILDLAMKSVNTLMSSYEEIGKPIEGKIKPLREKLVSGGVVSTFGVADPAVLASTSMATIDGANAMDQMANADLFFAVATLGEGFHTKKLHDEDNDYPTYAKSHIIQHHSDNTAIISGVRAFLEVQALGASKHDIRIIDGSYLGNIISVFLEMLTHRNAVEIFIDMLDDDVDGAFLTGMDRIINPRGHKGHTIALSKSDSSTKMQEKLFDKADGVKITDRLLATYLLKPGEILEPELTERGSYLLSLINPDSNGDIKTKWSQIKEPLNHHQYSQFQSLLVEGLYQIDNNGVIDEDTLVASKTEYLIKNEWTYSTYFKPSIFAEHGSVLRCEFTYNPTSKNYDSGFSSAYEKAKWIAAIIDSDFVDPAIQEPVSQYLADYRAKEVGPGLIAIRNALISELPEDKAVFFLNNYRT